MIKHLRPTPLILLPWLGLLLLLLFLMGPPHVFAGIGFLLIYALVCYLLVAVLLQLIGSRLCLRRSRFVAGMLVALLVLGPLPVSFLISKSQRNYIFAPPALVEGMDEIKEVRALIPVDVTYQDGEPVLQVDADPFPLSLYLENAREDPDLAGRLLWGLEQRGKVPAAYQLEATIDPNLLSQLRESDFYVPTTYRGGDDFLMPSGLVVEAVSENDDRLIFFGLSGHHLANDHYAYYEALVRAPASGGEYQLVRGLTYNYEWAGLEGAPWWALWILLSFLALLGGLGASFALLVFSRVLLPSWQ